MKKLVFTLLLIILYCNTYSQLWNNNNNIVNGKANDYLLCYIKSKPIVKNIHTIDSIISVKNMKIENIKSIIEIEVFILDIYVTKKYHDQIVTIHKSLYNDSLLKNLQLPLSNKTLNIVIVSDKKRVLKKFEKLYSKKQLFVIAPPFELNDNLLLIDENRYNYFFLKEFDYFDQLIRIE